MKCKICLTIDPNESGSICHSCSIAIQAMDLFIEDLGNYLSSADSERLPDHYAKNIPYFVSLNHVIEVFKIVAYLHGSRMS